MDTDNLRSRRRLLHLVFGAARGGVERDVLVMIQALPHIEHIVVVCGNDGPMVSDWRRDGASIEFATSASKWLFTISGTLRAALTRHQPDGVIAWFGMVHLPQIIHVCNRHRVKLLVHAGNPAHTLTRMTDLRYVALSYVWPPSGPLPHYVCCSEYVSASLATSRYLRNFPRSVVYNGIELPQVPPHQPKEYNPSVPFTIGMTARLSTIKDHDTLIRAFHIVSQAMDNVRLEIAGDGRLRATLANLTRDLGIAGKVTFLGDVANIYGVESNWDLFAYATTEREGLGNAVAEAMALGLPCLLTDVGPMREFAHAGINAKLVAPHSPKAFATALTELITDIGVRRELSAHGRRFALKQFSPHTFAEKWMEHMHL